MTSVVVILGRPGAGKGTQGQMLHEEMGFVHISTGEILRSAIRDGSELGMKAQEYVESGNLVPDSLMVALVRERLGELVGKVNGIIFDGFPRTVDQAIALRVALEDLRVGAPLVIELRLSDQRAAERIQGRGASSSDAAGRADDKSEVVSARMAVYESQTQPVVDYYEGLGILKVVDASGTREDVYSRLRQVVIRGSGTV